jgi:predicted metal-dependent HD superfamily phosphohydrolase
MNQERFSALCARLGIADAAEVFVELRKAYGESSRHYHTATHIDRCLAVLDASDPPPEHRDEVEYALFFHDAVYEPLSSSNEEKSARWAVQLLEEAGASEAVIGRVRANIMATRHLAEPENLDSQRVVDVDLSILGAPIEEYQRFEDDVRDEYRWVPDFLFRGKRAEILESFLARPHIYFGHFFRTRYEERARANLAAALERLRQ